MDIYYLYYFLDKILVSFLFLILSFYIYSNYRNRLLDFIFTTLGSFAISETLKSLINKPRPFNELFEYTFEGSSFPSTHSTVAFSMFFFVLFNTKFNKIVFSKKKYLIVLISGILASIIAILRVILGAHYVIDILAGAILGTILPFIFSKYDISIKNLKSS